MYQNLFFIRITDIKISQAVFTVESNSMFVSMYLVYVNYLLYYKDLHQLKKMNFHYFILPEVELS